MRRRCKDAHTKDPTRDSRSYNKPRGRSRSNHARPFRGRPRGVHYENQEEVYSQESDQDEEKSEEEVSEEGENTQDSERKSQKITPTTPTKPWPLARKAKTRSSILKKAMKR